MYERYVELRNQKGVSDYRVAKDTGIPKSTFSDWKSGRSKPKIAKLKILAGYFGVAVDELISATDETGSEKGKKGELELAAILKSYGYEDSRRGQQYCGSNGDADVVGLPRIHIECKRVEKLNIYDAVEQSKNDARTGEMPVVMHRKNRKEWLVTMPLDDWMKLYER